MNNKKPSLYLEKGLNIQLNETVEKMINEYCAIKLFSKESILLLQGECASNLYFIIKGLIRGYYIDEEGKDITKCFALENEFFSSEGFRTNKASTFHIESLEDSTCIQIPYHLLRMIMAEHGDVYKIFNQYLLTVFQQLEDRSRDFAMKSAKDRYIEFIEQYPELEKRIPQNIIASYIGIRAGSLSRIKKQIKIKIQN